MNKNELLDLLINLLQVNVPYGTENLLTKYLPKNGTFDDFGNYWVSIGESSSLFCCHMDTIGTTNAIVEPVYNNGLINATNSKAHCLGGDDKCGMLCLIAMIASKVPGTYLFHVGEEKGNQGAKFVANKYKLDKFKRAIEFDRRGKNSVINVMMGYNKVCSDEFAQTLCEKLDLDFAPDDTGMFTDVFEYEKLIPEITNISCGYLNEHSNKEIIFADWLINEFIPKIISIDWETLPTVRDNLDDNYIKKYYFSRYNFNEDDIEWGITEIKSIDEITIACDCCGDCSEALNYYPDGDEFMLLCSDCFNLFNPKDYEDDGYITNGTEI